MQPVKHLLQAYWKNNSLRRMSISASIFALIVLILPVIIQYSIIHLLKKHGATLVTIDDIELNLFAGSVELKQLSFSAGNVEPLRLKHLAVDLQMLDLFSRKLIVNSLLLDGLNAVIQRNKNGDFVINGVKLPAADASASKEADAPSSSENSFGYGIKQLSIDSSSIHYQESEFSQKVSIKRLSLNGLESWNSSSPTRLSADLKIDDASLSLSAELLLFASDPHIKGQGTLTNLTLTPYAKFYRDYVTIKQGTFSLKTDFDVTLASSIIASTTNELQLNELELDYLQLNQSVSKVHWKGSTDLQANNQLSVKGRLEINGSKTVDTSQDYTIASFDRLSIDALEKSLQSISFEQLDLDKLKLINTSSNESFVSLNALSMSKLKLDSDSAALSIGQISIHKPALQLNITAQKQLAQITPLQNTLDAMIPTGPDQTEADSKTDKPLQISIAAITLAEPGSIDFTDQSVTPNYHTQLFLNQIEITQLSPANNAHFVVAIRQGEYTGIDLTGDGLLFDPSTALTLKAQIKQLDLPPVTPYTTQAMGYGMKSGVVDTDIDLSLIKREIDALIRLKVDSIEIVETNSQTAEQVSSASGMSIDLAISTLKDSENIIQLELPVRGNIDQPDFDLSLVINQAMGKAMQSASLSYLKHSLQPLGSLITLYSLAKSAANHISLPPVLFATNSLDLKDDQQQLLDKVIKVLKERPGLKIKACGISSLEDQKSIHEELLAVELERLQKLAKKDEKVDPATITVDAQLIQQKMRNLADQRSAKVKAVFLQQGEIESRRILNCLSASKTEEKSEASVELTL